MRGRVEAILIALVLAGCGGSSSPAPHITLANLNFLHGIFCPAESASCRLEDRSELLAAWVRDAGCPDVVTLQEIFPPSVDLLESWAATVCPFPYDVVQGDVLLGVDDETVLSRYPILQADQLRLFGEFRAVFHVQVDHPTGPVDVFSTHLASGADGGRDRCDAIDCPAVCEDAGAGTRRECQAVQMAQWIEERHEGPNPALVAGDFNARPGSFTYRQFTERGWADAYLEAGHPECDPTTGIGCTAGREDGSLEGLDSPALGESVRIDFIFVVPSLRGAGCSGRIEPAGDPDGDGARTALFADAPNPFAPTCGPLPNPVCWPSDHVGVQVDLQCN